MRVYLCGSQQHKLTFTHTSLGERTPHGPNGWGAPLPVAYIIGAILERIGPRGPDFAKYSIAYHYTRNLLYVSRSWGPSRAQQHIPAHARSIVREMFSDEELQDLLDAGTPRGLVGGHLDLPYQTVCV